MNRILVTGCKFSFMYPTPPIAMKVTPMIEATVTIISSTTCTFSKRIVGLKINRNGMINPGAAIFSPHVATSNGFAPAIPAAV